MRHLLIALLIIPSLLYSQEMRLKISTSLPEGTVFTHEGPHLLPTKPRTRRNKSIIAAVTGTLATGLIVAGYIYKSKETEYHQDHDDLAADFNMSSDPNEKAKIKITMEEKLDDAHRMNTYRKRCFAFGGVSIIVFTVNLIIPSRKTS